MILFLLPLIMFASAQECPYCRWNACTLTEGCLASCSDCHTGALVNFQLDDPNAPTTTVGICVLCPGDCATCEYAALPRDGIEGLAAANCTSCNAGSVHDASNGKCVPCSMHCGVC